MNRIILLSGQWRFSRFTGLWNFFLRLYRTFIEQKLLFSNKIFILDNDWCRFSLLCRQPSWRLFNLLTRSFMKRLDQLFSFLLERFLKFFQFIWFVRHRPKALFNRSWFDDHILRNGIMLHFMRNFWILIDDWRTLPVKLLVLVSLFAILPKRISSYDIYKAWSTDRVDLSIHLSNCSLSFYIKIFFRWPLCLSIV